MFKCGITGKISESGERGVRVVTQRRPKIYYGLNKEGEQVEVGQGWEIVKEVLVCNISLVEMNQSHFGSNEGSHS